MSSDQHDVQTSFNDRLLAEALRVYEDDGRRVVDDPIADMHAAAVEGDFEKKIVVRARSAQIAAKLRDALRGLNTAIGWIVFAGLVLAFVLGAGTASATLGTASDGIVNFYWVLLGILGVQTIVLIVWIVAMIVATFRSLRRRNAHEAPSLRDAEPAFTISLGAAVLGIARWIAVKLARDAHHVAAISAAARVYSTGKLGKWAFSSITHALWLSFNIGCIAFIFILLAARDYTFVWETTILRSEHYVTMTRGLSALPDRLGIVTPSREQIEASQWPISADSLPPHEAREAWAGLLVGAVVLYGFGPRILLLGLSLSRRRAARSRYRLDVAQPGYARLESRLMPRTVAIGKIGDGEMGDDGVASIQRTTTARPVASAHAILGLENTRPKNTAWPPSVHGIAWDDFGIIEGGDDQRAALDRLASSPTEPASLLIICDLTTTPDRGLMRFIAEAKSRITQPVAIVLTAGQALRERRYSSDEVAQRVQDWRELAKRSGIDNDRIIELDLDNLTESGRKKLKDVLAGEQSRDREKAQRHIEGAFDLIVQEAAKWESSGATLESQAELHRRIAHLYQAEGTSWRDLLQAPSSLTGDVTQHIRSSAERVQSLLPPRLLKSPKWMAAGALSGALGCIAAATLISPIAIGALPMWSAIGAAIAAIASFSKSNKDDSGREQEPTPQLGDAVRSAALFAMLLELQGRDEATITRILDKSVGDQAETEITTAQQASTFLDNMRHRLDMSIARSAQ